MDQAPATSLGKLLVTGATGLVGSHVVAAATRAGYDVRALVRSRSADAVFVESLGAELSIGDLRSEASLKAAVAGCDFVVHCAAQVGDWGREDDYRDVNLTSLKVLLQLCGEADLRRFVALSSLGVYEPRDHFGTDETTPAFAAGLDAYARTKALAEDMVQAAAQRGLKTVQLRPGFVYGPRDRHVMPNLLQVLAKGHYVFAGDGEQLLDQIYVENLADAVLLALTAPAAVGEIFNLTDDPPVTRHEFVGTVARLFKLKMPTLHLPRPLLKTLAFTLDSAARRLNTAKPPLLSKGRYKFLALNLHFSIAKAKHLLCYKPRFTFQGGMAQTAAWFGAQKDRGGR